MLFVDELTEIIDRAIHDSGYFNDSADLIQCQNDTAFGEYKTNVAIRIASKEQLNPVSLAVQIAQNIELFEIGSATVLDGLIYIKLNPGYIERKLALACHTPKPNKRQRIIVDYSGPNTAYPMRAESLRSSCVGDVIANILEHQGHEVKRQNHLKDFSIQLGMLMQQLNFSTDFDAKELEKEYTIAVERFRKDKEFQKEAHKRLLYLQNGGKRELHLWSAIMDVYLPQFNNLYKRLGIRLNQKDEKSQSQYAPYCGMIVTELITKQIAVGSYGAVVCLTKDKTPIVIRNEDGTYTPATFDLAAMFYRSKNLGADRIIYVRDKEQVKFYNQLFQIATSAGWFSGTKPSIVPVGIMLGKTQIKLSEFVEEAISSGALYSKKLPAHVGIGAIKYSALAHEYGDFVFNWDKALSNQSNSSLYIQSVYASICHLLKENLSSDKPTKAGPMNLEKVAEMRLALKLLRFPEAVSKTASELNTQHLCTYLYEVAQAYNNMRYRYEILGHAGRLKLAAHTLDVLAEGTYILGITTPEAMV